MSVGSIVIMIIGMIVIWGGLIASITHAMKKSRQAKAK